MNEIATIYLTTIATIITIGIVGVVKIKQDIVKIKDKYVNKI